MTGFITPERIPNRRAEALGLDILPASAGEGFGAALEDAWVRNPGPSMLRQLNRARYGEPFGPEDPAGIIGFQRPKADEDFEVLPAQQANEKYGIEGELTFEEDTPEPVARDLNRLKKEELQRQDVLRRAQSGLVTTISAGLIASIADPVNVASAFFPVVGPARYASLVARHGAGKARVTVGAIEGTVGAGVVEPAVYFTAQSEQADYDEVDTLVNLAFGTVLGSGLHLAGGALGDRIQARSQASRLQREVDDLPRAEQEAVFRTAATQLFEDRPVRVGPALEAARQKMNTSRRGRREPIEPTVDALIDSPAGQFFAGDIRQRAPEFTNPKSRTSVVMMPTDDFLRLLPGTEDATGQAVARIEAGEELELPRVSLDSEGRVSPGTGLGRDTVLALRERGIEEVPVQVEQASARFGEEGFPGRIQGEDTEVAGLEPLFFTNDGQAKQPTPGRTGTEGTPEPRVVVERAIMDSIGDPHPEWQAAARAHTARAEAVSGEPRNLADEETAVTENLAEWEEMLTPEERTRLADELKDEAATTRNYEKAWRLGAVCRIKGNT